MSNNPVLIEGVHGVKAATMWWARAFATFRARRRSRHLRFGSFLWVVVLVLAALLANSEAWSTKAPLCRQNVCSSVLRASAGSESPAEQDGIIRSAANSAEDPALNALEDRRNEAEVSFRIKPCQYADLNVVSDIIMESFYDDKVAWRRLLKLAELNRLQQNFPYVDTDLHQMFVAVLDEEKNGTRGGDVVGFVDVDARPCRPEVQLPRPYLSDLAVKPEYRRRGIAQALIEEGEKFIRSIPRKELFIRVEESNEAAVRMYTQKLYYSSQGVEVTRDKKRIMKLHKLFNNDLKTNQED